jgi:hypothetical protein
MRGSRCATRQSVRAWISFALKTGALEMPCRARRAKEWSPKRLASLRLAHHKWRWRYLGRCDPAGQANQGNHHITEAVHLLRDGVVIATETIAGRAPAPSPHSGRRRCFAQIASLVEQLFARTKQRGCVHRERKA